MDGVGIPLAMVTTKANAHDLQSALKTIDAIRVGNRRRRPRRVRTDKGYDSIHFRKELRKRGIKSAVDHRTYRNRRAPSSLWNDAAQIRYGRKRWRVEQRFACLDQNRRLNFLFERTRDTYEAFLTLACIRQYLRILRSCRQRRRK